MFFHAFMYELIVKILSYVEEIKIIYLSIELNENITCVIAFMDLQLCEAAKRNSMCSACLFKYFETDAYLLTLCLLGTFSYFYVVSRFIFISTFSKHSFRCSNCLDQYQA